VAEDFSVAQGDLALRKCGHLGVVGDHYDCVSVCVQVLQKPSDDLLVGGVEISGGLVSKQNRRIVN